MMLRSLRNTATDADIDDVFDAYEKDIAQGMMPQVSQKPAGTVEIDGQRHQFTKTDIGRAFAAHGKPLIGGKVPPAFREAAAADIERDRRIQDAEFTPAELSNLKTEFLNQIGMQDAFENWLSVKAGAKKHARPRPARGPRPGGGPWG